MYLKPESFLKDQTERKSSNFSFKWTNTFYQNKFKYKYNIHFCIDKNICLK